MSKRQKARQLISAGVRLTRYREFMIFVVITTILGAKMSGNRMDYRLVLALIANWLSVGFSFMINDVEDADDDALNPAKIHRNPVSAGALSHRAAYAGSWAVALLALCTFAFLGTNVFIIGFITVLLGLFYSWRMVRLKRVPVVDLISHAFLLSGLQFLCGYFTYSSRLYGSWIFPFITVVAISMYGELFNEIRDLVGDKKAGLTHSAAVFGEKQAKRAMRVLLILALVSILYSVYIGILPLWLIAVVILLFLAVSAVSRKSTTTPTSLGALGDSHVLFQLAGAGAMILWVLVG